MDFRILGPLEVTVAAVGLAGGALEVVGATARQVGTTLLTLDRRAVATYHLLGVDYELVADPFLAALDLDVSPYARNESRKRVSRQWRAAGVG